MVFHSDNTLVLHTVALGVSPSADAMSVDSLLRRDEAGLTTSAEFTVDDAHWRYGTVGTAMNLGTAAVYLLSGVAKVAGPLGWRWADGASLRSQVEADALRKGVLGAGVSPAVHGCGTTGTSSPPWRAAAWPWSCSPLRPCSTAGSDARGRLPRSACTGASRPSWASRSATRCPA